MLAAILLSVVSLISVCPKSVSPGESFTYHVEINKENVRNVARFTSHLPKEFDVTPVSTLGSQFTFEDGEIKLIWVFLPPEDNIVLSFVIRVPENYNKPFEITNSFDYVLGQNKMNETGKTVKVDINETPEEIKNDVIFKVQVLATNKPLEDPMSFFLSNYGLGLNDLTETSHQGMIKYVSGEFNNYITALDYRDELENSGCPAPFVVAYHRSVRIPLSEAITLSRLSK